MSQTRNVVCSTYAIPFYMEVKCGFASGTTQNQARVPHKTKRFGHLDTHPNDVSLGYPEGPRGALNQFQNPQIRIIVEVGLGGGDPYDGAWFAAPHFGDDGC